MPSALLLADINPRATIACLRSLSRHGVPVHCATSRPGSFVRYTRYRDSAPGVFYRTTDQATFCNSLIEIAETIGECILFPAGERILRWAVANKEMLAARGMRLPTVGIDVYERVSDKKSFVSLAATFGLCAPAEREGIPKSFDGKVVVKPRRGVWDRPDVLTNPVLVESAQALHALSQRNLDPISHFVQEYIEGPSYYYCALYDRGRKLLDFVQRTLVQQPDGRAVVKAFPAVLPGRVLESIDAMMRSLDFHGLMMAEVREAPGGRYYAIECNPRLWGPLQLALDNGADFPFGLWQLATGEEPLPRRPVSVPVGYIWRAGYLEGWILKRRTGVGFQKYPDPASRKVRFREVWLRADAFLYFCVELMGAVRSCLRRFVGDVRLRRSA